MNDAPYAARSGAHLRPSTKTGRRSASNTAVINGTNMTNRSIILRPTEENDFPNSFSFKLHSMLAGEIEFQNSKILSGGNSKLQNAYDFLQLLSFKKTTL